MGLINFIKSGFFRTLFDFSDPACAGFWLCILLGAAAQMLLNKKARKPERRLILAIAMAVILVLLEFSQYSKLFTPTPTFLYIYGLALCLLIGIAVPAIVFWIRNRRAGDKGLAETERPEDKNDRTLSENENAYRR